LVSGLGWGFLDKGEREEGISLFVFGVGAIFWRFICMPKGNTHIYIHIYQLSEKVILRYAFLSYTAGSFLLIFLVFLVRSQATYFWGLLNA